jgi:hypothetical protein
MRHAELWRWKKSVSPKRLLTFSGLHSVISKKIDLSSVGRVPGLNPGRVIEYTEIFQLILYDTVSRNKVSIYINSLYFLFFTHYMFRPLWAILRWDILLVIFLFLKDYFNTTDPLHACNSIIISRDVICRHRFLSAYSPNTCYHWNEYNNPSFATMFQRETCYHIKYKK